MAFAWVFTPSNQKFSKKEFKISGADDILIKNRCTTICGSDVHSISGRRAQHAPLVLGHESCGSVINAPANHADMTGLKIKTGDRVVWMLYHYCNTCESCLAGIPQKCTNLKKFGHGPISTSGYTFGGFSSHVSLDPSHQIIKIPASVPDALAAMSVCAGATVQHIVKQLPKKGIALILGAGALGILAGMNLQLKEYEVYITDKNLSKIDLMEKMDFFPSFISPDLTDTPEFNCIIDFTGHIPLLQKALLSTRPGCEVFLGGSVVPGDTLILDPHLMAQKCMILHGIHNYTPEDLIDAIDSLSGLMANFNLMNGIYLTDSLDDALDQYFSNKYLRVGLNFR